MNPPTAFLMDRINIYRVRKAIWNEERPDTPKTGLLFPKFTFELKRDKDSNCSSKAVPI